MKIRPEWTSHLHAIRKDEVDRIFSLCPEGIFPEGLELGAGDGFQSTLLSRCITHLTCSEYSSDWLSGKHDSDRVSYRACDAENICACFRERTFDIVFSSNVLEHLPQPGEALKGIHHILKDDGITVHIVPNPLWKAGLLALFYPHVLLMAVERLTDKAYLKRKLRIGASAGTTPAPGTAVPVNNPKTPGNAFRRFWPVPHGAYSGHSEEFFAFRKKRWLEEFDKAGFEVVKTMKGPLMSGYGFGLDGTRRCLERLGLTSENILIARKKGFTSGFLRYF